MSEVSLCEREKIFNQQSPIFKGYMSVMKFLIFPNDRFQLSDKALDYILYNGREIPSDEDFKEPENFKKLENTFASPGKFEELKESFRKIFSRKYNYDKNALSPKQKEALIKWYGLGDQEAYYCNKDGFWKLSRELNLSRNHLTFTLDRSLRQLKEPGNFNLLPEEAKKLAKI